MNQNGVNFFKKIIFILLSVVFMAASTSSFALPFHIVHKAGTTLPTSVVSGTSVDAFYTVFNNTSETRNNNYLKYLPPNVTQVSNTGECAASFSLAPAGSSGDSCTLHLSVSGAVDSSDPDSSHHLFACFPGGTSCAGTDEPLNVTQLPPVLTSITITASTAYIHLNQTDQFTATGNYSDGSTQNLTATVNWTSLTPGVASISSNGLATGLTIGSSSITISNAGVPVNTIVLHVISVAYISNRSANSISICPVNTGGTLGTCSPATGSAFVSPTNLSFNASLTYAYIANSTYVSSCPVNASGTLGVCTTNTGFTPTGVAIDPVTNVAYVTNGTANVSICQVSGTGSLNSCVTASESPNPLVSPTDIAVNASGTYAYITDPTSTPSTTAALVYCVIDSSTENFDSCVSFTASGILNDPLSVALSPSGTYAYVADEAEGVALCNITGGAVNSCENAGATTISGPTAIAINPAGTIAYVTSSTGTSYYCAINASSGLLSGCTSTGQSFTTPHGIAVN